MISFLAVKVIVGTVVASIIVSAVVNVWRFSLSMLDRSQRKTRRPL